LAPPPPPPQPAPQAGYPAQPYPAQDNVKLLEPKKKFYTRVWFWLLVAVVVLLGGCTAAIATGVAVFDHAAHEHHTIVYTVTGDGPASNITYDTLEEGSGQNGKSQVTNVDLPWSKKIVASGLFVIADVSVAAGENGGSVTCTITEDGRQIATNTASGSFASAACSSVGSP
jgi:hypothetical protein